MAKVVLSSEVEKMLLDIAQAMADLVRAACTHDPARYPTFLALVARELEKSDA